MKKHFILHGAMFMALAVILGALSSHGLNSLSDSAVNLFKLGVQYQVYHAIGLIAIGIMIRQAPHEKLYSAGRLMFIGMVLFCGGLYAYALSGVTTIKYIIPVGGLCLIASWLSVVWAIFSSNKGAK